MPVFRFSFVAAWLLISMVVAGCSTLSRSKLDENVLTARQLSLRGTEAIQRGKWGDAEALMSQAVQICPLDERMRCQYAETLWNLGARDEATQHMEFAVRLSGGNPELLVRLGEMYLQTGQFQRAAEQAERAIAVNSQLASAWALRGDVFQRLGEDEEGLACYHRALSYVEHYPQVQLAIAESYRRQGRHSRSLATLHGLADGYPAGEVPREVRFHEGLAQKELGRYEAAIVAFAEAARRSTPSPELLYHMAETHLLMDDPANARIAVKAALALQPDHRPSRQLLARMETHQRDVAVVGDTSGLRHN